MKYLSLFSGALGADLGVEAAGWESAAYCEVDPVCVATIKHNRPGVPIIPDVRHVDAFRSLPAIDALWMSPPCQDLSVAGDRVGLQGMRSNLFYDAIAVIRALRECSGGPRFVLMEQVPGLLYSDRGRDLSRVLAEFLDLGACDICWRVLDSQHFGVAQRRRRMYFAIDFGGDRAAEILALAEGLRGRPAQTHEPPEGQTAGAAVGAGESSGTLGGGSDLAKCLTTRHRRDLGMETFIPTVSGTLRCGGRGGAKQMDPQDFLMAGPAYGVRCLTPRECERLQGWPNDWTRWAFLDPKPHMDAIPIDEVPPYWEFLPDDERQALVARGVLRRKAIPSGEIFLAKRARFPDGREAYEIGDAARYKMIGNGVTAPCSAYLARNLARAMADHAA